MVSAVYTALHALGYSVTVTKDPHTLSTKLKDARESAAALRQYIFLFCDKVRMLLLS